MKQFVKLRQQDLHLQHCAKLHLEVVAIPMQFISMDFIDKFKLLPQWYLYALTVIDIVTFGKMVKYHDIMTSCFTLMLC